MIGALVLALVSATSDAASFSGTQPQLAGSGRRVGLVFGREGGLYFASSQDGGRSFGAPVALPDTGRLHLGNRRGPRVALVDKTFVVTAIVGRDRDDGDVLAWTSSNDGRSWTGPSRLNGVVASAREGLHGMASGAGLVAVAWLDLRGPGTRVFAAVSRDRGASWSQDFLAYEAPSGSVCECCHPSLAISGKGELAVMFRNHVGGSRDLYLVRSPDAGPQMGPAVKLGQGTWPLEGCPMDGGSVAFDGERGPVTAWRRDKEVFLARPGAAEERLGEGRDPVVAVTEDGATYAAWRQGRALLLSSSRSVGPRILAPEGQAPVLVALGHGSLVAAWQQDDRVIVAPVSP
jgi:hypothetical protein